MSFLEKFSNKNRVETKDGDYYSVIGKSKVKISQSIGERVSKLLSLQTKVAQRLPHRKDLISLIQMLNCRKIASLTTNMSTLGQNINTNTPQIRSRPQILQEVSENFNVDADGILEMLRRIQIELDNGTTPAFWTANTIMPLLKQIGTEPFPKMVHVFEVKKSMSEVELPLKMNHLTLEDILKMGFVHTFVVLGKDEISGTIHCFHKQGPEINQIIEIVELSEIFTLDFYLVNSYYMSIAEEI